MMAMAAKAVEALKKDPKMLDKFMKNPVPVVEGFVGMDLPDEQIMKVVDLVKAQVKLEDAGKVLNALGGLLGNLALAPGNAHNLTALGTGEVAVPAVTNPVAQGQESAVFLIPLVGIAGQAAENCPDHHAIAECPEKNTDPGSAQEGGQNKPRVAADQQMIGVEQCAD